MQYHYVIHDCVFTTTSNATADNTDKETHPVTTTYRGESKSTPCRLVWIMYR